MAGTFDRLTQSPTFRAYQGRLPTIKTGAAAGYDLSGGQSVPTEYLGGGHCGAPLEQAGETWCEALPERGLLPPFEDRFADFPEPLRWRLIDCCRAAVEQCLRDVTAEIRGLTPDAAVPEDIFLYDSILAAAHITGVDAEETRWRLYAYLTAAEEQATAAAAAARRA
ncbi:unnamed protein product [Spirodela intermedia]|uniref:Uncharacterized protein n=1 Tax=Spirodela intermedia TaxID=51605 RepID=A0A7I8LMN8_SPIIN|nr:unnamed protein product [Spirodela intermedia]CAA7410585.1 unnamed protein product [Spirodela intermedia]